MRYEWKRQWTIAETGHDTRELIPEPGKRLCFPKQRDIGMSYVRLLLNMSTLNSTLFGYGFVDSPDCKCENSKEDRAHFFAGMSAVSFCQGRYDQGD